MKKMQILFPEPQLRRLREIARREDKPVSEIIRRAAEEFLEKLPPVTSDAEDLDLPVFDGGRTLVPSERFRELAYEERAGEAPVDSR